MSQGDPMCLVWCDKCSMKHSVGDPFQGYHHPCLTNKVKEWEEECVTLKETINIRKSDVQMRLPSMTTVRNVRQAISYEVERKVAEELMQNQSAIIPDGTLVQHHNDNFRSMQN